MSDFRLTYRVPYNEVEIELPYSKSVVNRLAVICSLGNFGNSIRRYSTCDDTDIILDALASEDETCNVGASGTALRFLLSYYALKGEKKIITGSRRLCERPVGDLTDKLKELGAHISFHVKEGFPPVYVDGGMMRGGVVDFSKADISSQYISSLMLVAPYLEGGLVIHLPSHKVSYPYILMTADIMRAFGAEVFCGSDEIKVSEGKYIYNRDFKVAHDWSAASYWYELVSIIPSLSVRLKDMQYSDISGNCRQGDSVLVELYKSLNVETTTEGNDIILKHISGNGENPDTVVLDLSDYPDIVPALAFSCLLNNRKFEFSGTGHLRYKESDRITAIINEARKIGYDVKWDDARQLFYWGGGTVVPEKNIIFETYNDHRLTMSLAVASSQSGNTIIKDASNVAKSYNTFWEDMVKAGFKINELHKK